MSKGRLGVMIQPVAVFYDEWGVPIKLRYVSYAVNDIELSGSISLKELESCISSIRVGVLTLDDYADICAKYCIISMSDALNVKLRRGTLCLGQTTHVLYDGSVRNDSLQMLHYLVSPAGNSSWALMADWRGKVKWFELRDLTSQIEKCSINVFAPRSRFACGDWNNEEYLTEEPDYCASSVTSLLSVETSGVALSGNTYSVLAYEGLRILKLGKLQDVVVPAFWNVIVGIYDSYSVKSQLVCCPSEAALRIENITVLRLRAPDVCFGFNVICLFCNELVLPREMREFHRGAGVCFHLSSTTLPESLTQFDMSRYYDLVSLDLFLGTCHFTDLTLMMPKRGSFIASKSITDNLNDVLGCSYERKHEVTVTKAKRLETLTFTENNSVLTVSECKVLLGETDRLGLININTVCGVTLSVTKLADLVQINFQRYCDFLLDLRTDDKEVQRTILRIDTNLWLSSVKYSRIRLSLVFKSDCRVVTSNFEEEIEAFRAEDRVKSSVLVCCSEEFAAHFVHLRHKFI